MKLSRLFALGALVVAGTAGAVQVNPVSYDMPNGSAGTFDYFDDTYNGAGCTTCSLSPLSGGLGQLTDGVIATQNWNIVEAPAGPGPYVGWMDINPTITFHFGSSVAVDSVTFHFDDSGFGLVSAPASVTIGATTYNVINPVGTDPFAFTVSGLGFVGTDMSVQINRTNSWSFVSEITFQSPVPEAGTSALFIAGLGALVGLSRRRRRGA